MIAVNSIQIERSVQPEKRFEKCNKEKWKGNDYIEHEYQHIYTICNVYIYIVTVTHTQTHNLCANETRETCRMMTMGPIQRCIFSCCLPAVLIARLRSLSFSFSILAFSICSMLMISMLYTFAVPEHWIMQANPAHIRHFSTLSSTVTICTAI